MCPSPRRMFHDQAGDGFPFGNHHGSSEGARRHEVTAQPQLPTHLLGALGVGAGQRRRETEKGAETETERQREGDADLV